MEDRRRRGLFVNLELRVAAVAARVNEWLTGLNSLAAQHDRLGSEARQIIREMQWLGEIVRGATHTQLEFQLRAAQQQRAAEERGRTRLKAAQKRERTLRKRDRLNREALEAEAERNPVKTLTVKRHHRGSALVWLVLKNGTEITVSLSRLTADLIEVLTDTDAVGGAQPAGWRRKAEIAMVLSGRTGHPISEDRVTKLVSALRNELSRAKVNPYLVQTHKARSVRFALWRRGHESVTSGEVV